MPPTKSGLWGKKRHSARPFLWVNRAPSSCKARQEPAPEQKWKYRLTTKRSYKHYRPDLKKLNCAFLDTDTTIAKALLQRLVLRQHVAAVDDVVATHLGLSCGKI